MEARGTRVWWKWVKGHSNHTWNNRADELADKGREEMEGRAADTDGHRERVRVGGQKPGRRPREVRDRVLGVRWVTYDPTITRAVMHSSTRMGCLNLVQHARGQVHRSVLNRAAARGILGVREEERNGKVNRAVADAAVRKINRAAKELGDTKVVRERREQRVSDL